VKGAAAEASKPPYKRGRGCWAAGEYVADCHESGALSSVRGGIMRFRTASKACKTARFPFFSERAFYYFSNKTRRPNAKIGKRVFYFLITLKL
jgi:hypothetical protein